QRHDLMALWIAAAAVVVPIVASEIAIGGRKLQTGLTRALLVWGVCGLAAIGAIAQRSPAGTLVLAAFWSGAFLTWFGVRSHVESSILLRMLMLLRRRPMADAQVVDAYGAIYGRAQRLAELRHGGFVDGDPPRVTGKGRTVLRVVSLLRDPDVRVPLALLLAVVTLIV